MVCVHHVHSLDECLLNTCCVPRSVLGNKDHSGERKRQSSLTPEKVFLPPGCGAPSLPWMPKVGVKGRIKDPHVSNTPTDGSPPASPQVPTQASILALRPSSLLTLPSHPLPPTNVSDRVQVHCAAPPAWRTALPWSLRGPARGAAVCFSSHPLFHADHLLASSSVS